MQLSQYLRILWARKWLVLGLLVLIGAAGTAFTLNLPRQYSATTSLIVDIRIDPALGAIAPALAAPSYMQTQLEVLRSERVASRAVKILGVENSPGAVAQWRDATKAKIPLERYFAGVLSQGLSVDASSGSNIINLWFTAQDPIFAQAAANAYARAYMDVSVELRVAPARQTSLFLDEQAKGLRAALEETQARLSRFSQSKGIVVTDERFDQENARYSALLAQLGMAQAEGVETAARQRFSGGESSLDVLGSGAIQGLKSQLATAQTRLTEISSIVGRNHPNRIALEAQIAEIQRQITAETRRVSGGTAVANRGNAQKVGQLQSMVDQQKKQVLALRNDRDQIAVYARDVEAAQRAYDAVAQRQVTVTMEGQNNQANTRLLSPAVEPLDPSKPKIPQGILASILGGLVVGVLAALGLELLDRRVRSLDDLNYLAGVPVIGVLRTAKSKQPVFRGMAMNRIGHISRPALAAPGGPR